MSIPLEVQKALEDLHVVCPVLVPKFSGGYYHTAFVILNSRIAIFICPGQMMRLVGKEEIEAAKKNSYFKTVSLEAFRDNWARYGEQK